MAGFTDLAKDREEERKKLGKRSFKGKAPALTRSGTAAGGGTISAAPITDINERLGVLESQPTNETVQEDVDAAEARLDAAEAALTTTAGNISSLDAALQSKADANHDHNGVYLTQAEINTLIETAVQAITSDVTNTYSVPRDHGPSTTEPTVLQDTPTISLNQYGRDLDFTRQWSDDFNDDSATTLFNRWQPDQMQEALHQVGNDNEPGWRWSALYTKPLESSFVYENSLHMRAHVEDDPHTFRKQYTWRGQTLNPQDKKIYLSFLSTWTRKWDNTQGHFVTDPDAPDRTWGPGTCFEWKVDLSEMRTQACRISFYLLPAYEHDSSAYTPDGTVGVEVDAPEIDFYSTYKNHAQAKVISETAGGNTPLGSIDLDEIIQNLNLEAGIHTFTLLWQKDKLVWYVNGLEYQRDADARRIPQNAHYWVISREANSGIRPTFYDPQTQQNILDDGTNAYSDGTSQMPVDVGIWGVPVWAEIDKLPDDTAKILSFTSWDFTDTTTAGDGIGDDTSGASPLITSANPPTVWDSNTSHTFSIDPNGRSVYDWYVQIGSTRGGNELYQTALDGGTTLFTVQLGYAYSGPVNMRLWFRDTAHSPWNWRDYGFSSGLQPYRTGTNGNIRVTVPSGLEELTPPTVAGLNATGLDRDGKFADSITYPGGNTKPSGYKADQLGLGITVDNLVVTLPTDGKYWQIQNVTDVNNVTTFFEGNSTGNTFTLTAGDWKFINFTDGTEISSVTLPLS